MDNRHRRSIKFWSWSFCLFSHLRTKRSWSKL